MNPNAIIRWVILVLSAAAAGAGVLIILGELVPRNLDVAPTYRVVLGAVVLLYGVYRFVVALYRRTGE